MTCLTPTTVLSAGAFGRVIVPAPPRVLTGTRSPAEAVLFAVLTAVGTSCCAAPTLAGVGAAGVPWVWSECATLAAEPSDADSPKEVCATADPKASRPGTWSARAALEEAPAAFVSPTADGAGASRPVGTPEGSWPVGRREPESRVATPLAAPFCEVGILAARSETRLVTSDSAMAAKAVT